MRNIYFILFASLLIVGCNKEPGKGGTSTIKGKVYRYETNSLGQVLDEYYFADRDVYIIYGAEDETYDDKFSTSFDGSYEFNNLTPGSYTLFVYSRCDTCAGGETAVTQSVEVTDKKQVIVLEDLITYK